MVLTRNRGPHHFFNLDTMKSMKTFILVIMFFNSCLSFASNVSVQKFQLMFRPGERAGVLGKFTIQGKNYWMLIDSGASGHSLNYKLVQKLKLTLGKTGQGSTPYGDIQIIHVGNVQVQLDGKRLDLRSTITVKDSEGDMSLEKDDIWGLISPSVLAANKLVVLDLIDPAMYVIDPVPKNILGWLNKKYRSTEFEEHRRVSGRPYVEIIETMTDLFGKLKMTVDSGATTTNIYSDSPFDNSKPLSIRFAKHFCSTRNARIRPTTSPGHLNHLLGMDCLRGKILVLPPHEYPRLWIGF